jgi:FixJ family two-component response regulator
MKAKPKVVAVIDDDRGVRDTISRLLWPHGYDTAFYASAKEFLAAMPTEAICLIVDIKPGKSCGIEFAECLKNVGFTPPILVTTAGDNESFKRRAMEMACVAFLPKPFSADVLIEALRDIPRHPRLGADQTSQGRAVDTRLLARWSSRRLAAALGVLQQTILRIWRVWLRDLSR